MSKFKKGDEVICTAHVPYYEPGGSTTDLYLQRGIVEHGRPDGKVLVKYEHIGISGRPALSQLELVEVYDTPLYQALK